MVVSAGDQRISHGIPATDDKRFAGRHSIDDVENTLQPFFQPPTEDMESSAGVLTCQAIVVFGQIPWNTRHGQL